MGPRFRGFVRGLVLVGVVATSLAIEVRPAGATTWTGRAISGDGAAVAEWTYEPVSGKLSASLIDKVAAGNTCAVIWVRSYGVVGGWSPWAERKSACGGRTEKFNFTMATNLRASVDVRACTGDGSCRASLRGDDCTLEFPVRQDIVTDRLDEVQYLDYIIVCSDFAESMTTIQNNTDVVWTISRSDDLVPLVTFSGESWTSQAFRAALPDTGLRPRLLPGSTAKIFAAPNLFMLTVAPELSIAHAPLDMIVDELAGAGLLLPKLLERSSKGWSALATCAGTLYTAFDDIDDVIAPKSISDLLLSSSGIAGSGIGCYSSLAAAVRERGGAWPDSITLPKLKKVFDSSQWATRWTTMQDILELIRRVGPG